MERRLSLPDIKALEITNVNGSLQHHIQMVKESPTVASRHKALHRLRKYLAAGIKEGDFNVPIDSTLSTSNDVCSKIKDAHSIDLHVMIVALIKDHLNAQFEFNHIELNLLREAYWILTILITVNCNEIVHGIKDTGIFLNTIALIKSCKQYSLVVQCFRFLKISIPYHEYIWSDELLDKSHEILIHKAERICKKCAEDKCEMEVNDESNYSTCTDHAIYEQHKVAMIDFLIAHYHRLTWRDSDNIHEKVALTSNRLLTNSKSPLVKQKLLELVCEMLDTLLNTGQKPIIIIILDSGILMPQLLAFMANENINIRKITVQIFGKLILASYRSGQRLEYLRGYLGIVFPMLLHDGREVTCLVLRVLGRVVLNDRQIKQTMFDFSLIPYIMYLIKQRDDEGLALEALEFVGSFICGCSKEPMSTLISFDQFRCIRLVLERLLRSERPNKELRRIAEILIEITTFLLINFGLYSGEQLHTRPTLSKNDKYYAVILLLRSLRGNKAFELRLTNEEVLRHFKGVFHDIDCLDVIALDA